ncbi:MAG TPA: phosphate ABC transporter permease subunit PstC [Hyphomonadaceae bacterium]|nr:phosphate ABC transporter permease subunit PstC [Hyphomonadaceae bacterium]
MKDMTMAIRAPAEFSRPVDKAKKIGGMQRQDLQFHGLTFVATLALVAIFIGVIVTVLVGAWPSIQKFGVDFLTTSKWNPVTEKFGAQALIYGTVVTSAIAMILAVPTGIGIAIFLTEMCPQFLRRPIGIAVELLAGVPSIIYGIWGMFVFAPFFQATAQPWLIELFANVPVLQGIFAGPPYGIGVFTAGIILAIMILPFIAAVSRDVFETVPPALKESAYALGCTKAEVMSNVTLPYVRAGVVGGAMLALGRALGETMAVTFVIGNAHKISGSLFAPGTTISASIASEFAEAETDMHRSALIESGLILFIITFIVLALAQLMLRQLARKRGARA